MTKILTAAYEDRDSWSLDAMLFDGVLYLQEYMSDESIQSKHDTNPRLKSMMYQGYAFESYCTTSSPNTETSNRSNPWGGDVNTNVQWCSVCKTGIGQYRSILGGEVDCLLPPSPSSSISPDNIDQAEAVELKTNFALNSERDYINFEKYRIIFFLYCYTFTYLMYIHIFRHKLLKFYVQSCELYLCNFSISIYLNKIKTIKFCWAYRVLLSDFVAGKVNSSVQRNFKLFKYHVCKTTLVAIV